MVGRRWLMAVPAVVAIVVTACLGIAFMVPPTANTKELPQSIAVDGVAYERVHLVTLKTTPRRETVAVQVPATSRPIVVRASCRLAVLHTSGAMSVFMLETSWMRAGGNGADLPDTHAAEYLVCHPGRDHRDQKLAQSIDPAWLRGRADQLQLTWYEQDSAADTPSDSPASWALAVYIAR